MGNSKGLANPHNVRVVKKVKINYNQSLYQTRPRL